MRAATLRKHFALALVTRELSPMKWYHATRHTFASQWVMHDGSLEKLAAILGHSSTVVTERYAHLRVDLFGPKERAIFDIDLSPKGDVVPLVRTRNGPKKAKIGYAVVTGAGNRPSKRAISARK